MTRLCKLTDCSEKHFGKGYCSTHYQRWLRHGDPYQTAFERTTPGMSVEKRFSAKVEVTPSCWLWRGKESGSGYGVLRVNKRIIQAHRLSYSLLNKGIGKDRLIDHKFAAYGCPRHCVNPEHLQEVDRKANAENYSAIPKSNTSGYVGAYYLENRSVWMSRVISEGSTVHRTLHPKFELHVAAFYARLARAKYHNNNVIDKEI